MYYHLKQLVVPSRCNKDRRSTSIAPEPNFTTHATRLPNQVEPTCIQLAAMGYHYDYYYGKVLHLFSAHSLPGAARLISPEGIRERASRAVTETPSVQLELYTYYLNGRGSNSSSIYLYVPTGTTRISTKRWKNRSSQKLC